MSLQSRRLVVVRGNPGEKIPTGTRFRWWNAQRVLDSKIPHQAPADSKVPFGKFSPSFPGQVVDGTEDSGKVLPRPPASGADCLFRQVRGEVLTRPLCTPKSASVSRRNFFCPDSPPATTYSPGLKTHNLPLTIPNSDRPGGVLVPQLKKNPSQQTGSSSPVSTSITKPVIVISEGIRG